MQSMASWSTSSRHHKHPNVHHHHPRHHPYYHHNHQQHYLLLFITIIRVSPPLGPYNAINGQVSIEQSNTTCQTTEMQTQRWKNQMESYFCLSLKRPVSHKGQRMCKTSLRPAAAMSEVNMKRVQAGVSPPLFRAGPIARHQGAADVSHLKYWSSAREAFSTSKHLGRNPEYSELPSGKI